MKGFYSADHAEFSLIKNGEAVLKSNNISSIIAKMATGDNIKVSIPGGVFGQCTDFILDVQSCQRYY